MESSPLGALLAVLIAASFVGCGATESKPSSAEPGVASLRVEPDVRLSGVSVHRVTLERPQRVRAADGQEREVTELYLVRLRMSLPRPSGPALELFVGEERILEYGSWKDGLYFKVYDEERLQRLAGGEVAWRMPDRERVQSGRHLDIADPQDLALQKESEVLLR